MPSYKLTSVASRKPWAFLTPSLADLFFPVLLLAAFGRPASWWALLADGDTGWHIRTGDFILSHRSVPVSDLFSYSRPGAPWFAWEWLSDVLFSFLYRWHGLEAVVGFSAVLLCLSAVILLHALLRRGTGLWVALPVTLAVVSASSIHYLARPHIFSLFFVTILLILLDTDGQSPGWRVWLLVPLLAVWANLHGGFVSGIAILGLRVVVSACERNWVRFRRYTSLAALCTAATLVNPYGWHLHQHIVAYLRSSWIMNNVQEFQSPQVRSENMQVFAVLLLFGVALVSRAFAGRQWFEGAMVLAWAFAALRSARHVPIFAIAAAPLIAETLAEWWGAASRNARPRSAVRLLWDLSQEFGRSRAVGLWTPVLGVLALWAALPAKGLPDFPADRFPVKIVARNLSGLSASRILTSDQWGDYLIFHFYPSQRVFFDGRSDFYGPELGAEYQELMSAGQGWRELLDRYRFDFALLPRDWPLGEVLALDPGWSVVDRESGSVLLVRRNNALKRIGEPADLSFVTETHGTPIP